MTRTARLCLLLPTLLIAGCGSTSQETTAGSTSTPAGSKALVIYSRTGGIAGIHERLAVEPSGVATVSQGLPAAAKTKIFKLTASELDSLRKTLDAADLASLPSTPSQGCADCFLYAITYGGTTWKGDEATLPPAVRPAIQALDRLVARAEIDQPLSGK